MKTTKPVKPTRQQLERQILELESQLAHRYRFAELEIDKASTAKMMASGVLLQLTALGGREIINPVVIRDGLSPETIAAIKADLHRSYELTVMHKTKG
jgi:hypothetical protein